MHMMNNTTYGIKQIIVDDICATRILKPDNLFQII